MIPAKNMDRPEELYRHQKLPLPKPTIRFLSAERVCDLSTPCRAASKAAASSQILFLVGDVLPHKNMFVDILLVQGLLAY